MLEFSHWRYPPTRLGIGTSTRHPTCTTSHMAVGVAIHIDSRYDPVLVCLGRIPPRLFITIFGGQSGCAIGCRFTTTTDVIDFIHASHDLAWIRRTAMVVNAHSVYSYMALYGTSL